MKYYTEVFYIIYERNVPSIQCKVRLDRLSSREEIDALSLSLIDFYVPALTPRFHRSENTLQLSENITIFAICCIYTRVISEDSDDEHLRFGVGGIIYTMTF